MVDLIKELNNIDNYADIIESIIQKRKSIRSDKTLKELISLINEVYTWKIPSMQRIPKSDKKGYREIFVFDDEDALIQKACNKVLYDAYDKEVNEHVFSYRRGVRTYNAAQYIQKKLYSNSLYGYKLDISNYFMSINPNIIHQAIDAMVADTAGKELLHSLFNINKYHHKGQVYDEYLGIMPGCAISSFLANYILKDIDTLMENNSIIYARYSDDLVFMCDTEEECETLLVRLKDSLSELGLSINPKKIFKLSSGNPLTFLGLEISKNKIDISKQTFVNTKKVIKNIANEYRKKAEESKYQNYARYTKLCMARLNKVLYKPILSSKMTHKSSKMSYMFGNVDTIDTLLKLDFYIKDSLRYVYTGKHNKANTDKLPNKLLEYWGYKSVISLYNLYRLDKELYKNEVYLLNLPIKQEPMLYQPKELIFEEDQQFVTYNFKGSFADVYRNIIKGGYFYFNGIQVYAECLDIDIINRRISFNNVLIAEGDKLLLKEIKCNINGNNLRLIMTNDKVSDYTDTNPKILMENYVKYCFSDNLTSGLDNVYAGVPKYNLFRRYSLNEVATWYALDNLTILTPKEIREGLFLMYLYGHICSNVLWEGINYNHNLCKYTENNNITIVLKQEWLQEVNNV